MKEAVMLSMGANGSKTLAMAYSAKVRETLGEKLQFHDEITNQDDLMTRALSGKLKNISYIFSTWGMTAQSERDIRMFAPKLEAIFYAAGTVQAFAKPYMATGCRIYSAFRANAVPVAEYTLAQCILAGKGFYQAQRIYKETKDMREAAAFSQRNTGNYGQTVSLLGAGAIGRLVIGHLKQFNYRILVFDPFLSDEDAMALGVQKVDLHTAFCEADIVSNHLANNEHTVGMLSYEHFSSLKPYSTFINTGRGAQVVEADLARAMAEDETRTALLDVTWPEPMASDNPFFDLKNVINTPHIAGSQQLEVSRMGEYMLEAWRDYEAGTPSPHEVTLEMLETMA